MDVNKITEELKEKISSFRFDHSIRVAKEAKKLAKHYNINEEKAYLCGILHDIAREFPEEKIKEYINKYNLNDKLLDKENIEIAHAKIGPLYIKEKYSFIGADILTAINYHTLGNKKMVLLDKIIFLADKIARKNLNEELIRIKELAYKNIDEALLAYLYYMKKSLQSKNKRMHKDSMELLKQLEIKLT